MTHKLFEESQWFSNPYDFRCSFVGQPKLSIPDEVPFFLYSGWGSVFLYSGWGRNFAVLQFGSLNLKPRLRIIFAVAVTLACVVWAFNRNDIENVKINFAWKLFNFFALVLLHFTWKTLTTYGLGQPQRTTATQGQLAVALRLRLRSQPQSGLWNVASKFL